MPNLRVDNIKNEDGTSGPIFEGNLEFSTTAHVVLPKGTTAERPVGVSTGALRYNTSTSQVEYWDGTQWIQTTGYARDRGVFGGGAQPATVSTIDYVTISSTGNATSFGDLTVQRSELSACSSSSRGVFGGGALAQFPLTSYNVLDYITIATTGSATDFGDLTVQRRGVASCSNLTRGVFGGGYSYTVPAFTSQSMDYITISSVGNAINFGNLSTQIQRLAACSSSTRGVFGGGDSTTNTIDYITIATTGNSSDFGDLTLARSRLAACSSSTRGVFGGGYANNIMDYITIATTGNALDFGDLTVGRLLLSATSNNIRGIFGGGSSPSTVNTIDYITIATTGNATDFGDLTSVRQMTGSTSDCHGGLS